MKWDDLRRSTNVEDRRGQGGGFPTRRAGGGIGIGGLIIIGLIAWALGINPLTLLTGLDTIQGPGTEQTRGPATPRQTGAPADNLGQFVSAVLGSTEDRWNEIFTQAGARYRAPRLVIFSRATQSACGFAQSAMGPFYCPPEQAVYLDTSFFQDLQRRFGACPAGSKSCEFSQAYVIAHEIGHHVQNMTGILEKVREVQSRVSERERNALQVRVELQADCYAGVWANKQHSRSAFLEEGDVDAALQTASAIGDDMLQKKSQGYVVPDSFTHGSSEQRRRWFMNGFKSGSVQSCNTFAAEAL
ncbi:MAG: neutral zinc metallopeptidase [Bradyrhizobiaceae bacterium]|nr:neutral zinc metallopeptidase [Bradyrhizobiaceae bacterium]